MKKTDTFEAAMARLDEIVALLDTGEATLEESLGLFGEGAMLVADCNTRLENAKLTIETLFPDTKLNEVDND